MHGFIIEQGALGGLIGMMKEYNILRSIISASVCCIQMHHCCCTFLLQRRYTAKEQLIAHHCT